MGRLDLLDPPRDEDVESTCHVCGRWSRAVAWTFGRLVCGRASCLYRAKHGSDLAAVLVSDDGGLD